jgi:putative mRNA 3-end processing factor
MASGWMTLRGVRRRRGFDKGFAVSDHADFPGLLAAIDATGARRVLVTHGFSDSLARYLRETRSLDASVLPTRFAGEAPPDDAVANAADDDPPTTDLAAEADA